MATTVRRDEALSSPVQRQVEEQETTFTPISSLEAVGIPRGMPLQQQRRAAHER